MGSFFSRLLSETTDWTPIEETTDYRVDNAEDSSQCVASLRETVAKDSKGALAKLPSRFVVSLRFEHAVTTEAWTTAIALKSRFDYRETSLSWDLAATDTVDDLLQHVARATELDREELFMKDGYRLIPTFAPIRLLSNDADTYYVYLRQDDRLCIYLAYQQRLTQWSGFANVYSPKTTLGELYDRLVEYESDRRQYERYENVYMCFEDKRIALKQGHGATLEEIGIRGRRTISLIFVPLQVLSSESNDVEDGTQRTSPSSSSCGSSSSSS